MSKTIVLYALKIGISSGSSVFTKQICLGLPAYKGFIKPEYLFKMFDVYSSELTG